MNAVHTHNIQIGYTHTATVHAGYSIGMVSTPWGPREGFAPMCKNAAANDQDKFSGVRSNAVTAPVTCKRCLKKIG